MRVYEVMTEDPITIDINYSILDAAKKMRDENCGVLPIMDGDEIVGVVTDRDVTVYAVAEEKGLVDTNITEIMSEKVITCGHEELLEDIADRMSINDVRRLVVLGDDEKIKGIISIQDLMVNIGDEKMTDEVIHHVLKYA